MKPININVVKIKNLLGIINNPTLEDFLFEIVSFLENEKQEDAEFKIRDAYLKTRVRISSYLPDDLDKLVELGYLEKGKYSTYRVIKHLWES